LGKGGEIGEERWKREEGSKDKKGGRVEYWSDGIMGKSYNWSPFITPSFPYCNIPQPVFPRLTWVR
jgi:hypothetical protein